MDMHAHAYMHTLCAKYSSGRSCSSSSARCKSPSKHLLSWVLRSCTGDTFVSYPARIESSVHLHVHGMISPASHVYVHMQVHMHGYERATIHIRQATGRNHAHAHAHAYAHAYAYAHAHAHLPEEPLVSRSNIPHVMASPIG